MLKYFIKKTDNIYSSSFPSSNKDDVVLKIFDDFTECLDNLNFIIANEKKYHSNKQYFGYNLKTITNFDIVCSYKTDNVKILTNNSKFNITHDLPMDLHKTINDTFIALCNYKNLLLDFDKDNLVYLIKRNTQIILEIPFNEFIYDDNIDFLGFFKKNKKVYYFLKLERQFNLVIMDIESSTFENQLYNLDFFKSILYNKIPKS